VRAAGDEAYRRPVVPHVVKAHVPIGYEEWDLTSVGDAERERLAAWVRFYKQLRRLLHSGTVVGSDHPDPSLWVHGVVAADLSEAVYALATTATRVWSPPGGCACPGLDPEAVYRVAPLPPGDELHGPGGYPLVWWDSGAELSGRMLARGPCEGFHGHGGPARRPRRRRARRPFGPWLSRLLSRGPQQNSPVHGRPGGVGIVGSVTGRHLPLPARVTERVHLVTQRSLPPCARDPKLAATDGARAFRGIQCLPIDREETCGT
jgi:hypothetical protein